MGYWEDRMEETYESGEMAVNQYFSKLEKAFLQTKRELQRTIGDFYARYATENGLSYAAAMKQLDKAEVGELQDFIDLSMANIGVHNQMVNNMSIKARITRYQALEVQVDSILNKLYAIDYKSTAEKTMQEVYHASYYQTWYNIDMYRGFHSNFAQVNPREVETLLEYPFNGANFSARLWKQKDHLQTQLMESITSMLVQGRTPQTLTEEFAKSLKSKKFDAYRLLHTESSYLISQAAHKAYDEDGVEKYQVLATLDSKTCGVCGDLAGNVYRLDDAVVGKTRPPFHCFCRCTDIPFYDDDLADASRAARDPETGETYQVPADMSYKEWHAQYIEQNPEKALAEKKLRHEKSDRKQYEKYQELLGKEYVPDKFKDFQDMKYGTGNEYGILKAQAKGMGYYNKALMEEPDITARVKKVADQTGMDMAGLEYRVKGKDSYLEKIKRKYSPDGNDYEVKDILRYTYTATPEDLTDKTLKAIELHRKNGYNTVEVKNYWLNKRNPYNGINTTLYNPNGQAFELQYHTKESYMIKDSMHRDYEKWRTLDPSSDEAIALRMKMHEQSENMKIPDRISEVKQQ